MKKALIISFLFTGIIAATNAQRKSNLDFLKQYNGKYGFEAKLFNNAVIKQRLQKLLGAQQFNYLKKSIWQVETPIKIEKDFFYAWAMQAHSGGNPSATLLADINKNVLYVEIVKHKQVKAYSEDGNNAIPKELKDWVKTLQQN